MDAAEAETSFLFPAFMTHYATQLLTVRSEVPVCNAIVAANVGYISHDYRKLASSTGEEWVTGIW